MKNLSIKTTILFVFILAMMPAFLFAQSLKKSYDVVEYLDISTLTGDITIKKGTTNEIEVDGKWDEDKVKVRVEYSGKSLTIKEKSLSNNNNSNASNWILIVPDGLHLDVTSGTGSIDISGVEGNLKANTGTGHIEISDMEGRFNVNSGTGEIEITNAKGRFDLNSGTSDVIVANSSGKFDANSGTGDVHFKMVNPTGTSSLNSGTGDVKFVVDGGISADLSLNSGTGNAILDFHGNKIEGDFEMKCGLRSGKIVAPFGFDSERRTGNKWNGSVEKEARIGNAEYDFEISTGTGRAEVKS